MKVLWYCSVAAIAATVATFVVWWSATPNQSEPVPPPPKELPEAKKLNGPTIPVAQAENQSGLRPGLEPILIVRGQLFHGENIDVTIDGLTMSINGVDVSPPAPEPTLQVSDLSPEDQEVADFYALEFEVIEQFPAWLQQHGQQGAIQEAVDHLQQSEHVDSAALSQDGRYVVATAADGSSFFVAVSILLNPLPPDPGPTDEQRAAVLDFGQKRINYEIERNGLQIIHDALTIVQYSHDEAKTKFKDLYQLFQQHPDPAQRLPHLEEFLGGNRRAAQTLNLLDW